MQEKTVLITGADSGIGKETTRSLAQKGATIVMACRNLTKANLVCEAIKQESGNKQIEVMHLDLASISCIREFAGQFSLRHQQLNVLINNAGAFCMKREETPDGFEKSMVTNYLGPFLLTHLLLPLLKQTLEARIINLSSDGHFRGQIDLEDLHQQKKFSSSKAYNASKLAIVFFTQELAERLRDTDITVNALHPGNVATKIWNLWPNGKWYQLLLMKIIFFFLITPREGAQTCIYLASSDEVKEITGKYFYKKRLKEVSPKCRDKQLQKDLWQLSEKLTGIV
jgi:NAD(P)-dependent dehydrogenase (short-subunit alcohol dehydrogenase family)